MQGRLNSCRRIGPTARGRFEPTPMETVPPSTPSILLGTCLGIRLPYARSLDGIIVSETLCAIAFAGR